MGNYESYLTIKNEYKKFYATKSTNELNNIEMTIEFSWPHSYREEIALEVLREELKSRA